MPGGQPSMDAPAPMMSSSAGPLPSSRYATVPSVVRTTCTGAVSTSGPLPDPSTSGLLPDPHPARAAAAQHTASTVTAPLLKASTGLSEASYVTPPPPAVRPMLVPSTQLANYVVAHSMVSSPVAGRNLLSAFISSESPPAPEDVRVNVADHAK